MSEVQPEPAAYHPVHHAPHPDAPPLPAASADTPRQPAAAEQPDPWFKWRVQSCGNPIVPSSLLR